MAPEERSEIAAILERSRQDFNDAIAGVTEEQARKAPEEGRWSVLDCVEHVAVVEEIFLGRLKNAAPKEGLPVDKNREVDLLGRVKSREVRAQAPEHARPTNRFQSLVEAAERFNATRNNTLQCAEDRAAELYSLASEHPRFGPLNGTELLVIIAGHAQRHAAQIREVRAAIGAS